MSEKIRYNDAELEEFRTIILEKLEVAETEYEQIKSSLMNAENGDSGDASYFKALEDSSSFNKEEANRMAQRQQKFIQNLKAALVRIDNKTYGICRETGKLIPPERLRAVPHATLSIEAKNQR